MATAFPTHARDGVPPLSWPTRVLVRAVARAVRA
jgi:hypothetical protein